MLLRRQCGASPSPKSIAWAWLRNARQSLPCPARQSAVNGRNRVRRSTRPRAETAQGPAACGVKPKHPCGVFRFHTAPFYQPTQKGVTPRETTRALRHFQTCRPRGGVFLDCPFNPLCHAQKTSRRFTPHPQTPVLSCSAETTKPATRPRHSVWFAPKTPPST